MRSFFFIAVGGRQASGPPDGKRLPPLMDIGNVRDKAKPLPTGKSSKRALGMWGGAGWKEGRNGYPALCPKRKFAWRAK